MKMANRFVVVPHGVKYPSAQAMHVWLEGSEVMMCNESGGFVRRIRATLPLYKFLSDWDVVTPENTVETVWREATMDCAECGEINGYVIGDEYGGATRWNGWSCPAFKEDEIKRVIREHPDTYGEVWRFVDGVLEVFDCNEEVWDKESPGEIAVDGQVFTVWMPGYMNWCWEEVTPQLCHCGNDLEPDDDRCNSCGRSYSAACMGMPLPSDEACPVCTAAAQEDGA